MKALTFAITTSFKKSFTLLLLLCVLVRVRLRRGQRAISGAGSYPPLWILTKLRLGGLWGKYFFGH